MKSQRKDEIVKLLRENRIVKAVDLAQLFRVSMETIRRDLEELEKEQILRRVHGGAVPNVASGVEPDFSYRTIRNYEQKVLIAKQAAALVQNGDTIIMDIGTTTLEMAKFLKGKQITVFTNSVKIAMELMDEREIQLFMLGGRVRGGEGTTSGFMAEFVVQQLMVDKLFLGVAAIDDVIGVMDFHIEESDLRRRYVEHSSQVIALADYSKFGQKALNHVCRPKDLDLVITDERADKKILKGLRVAGVEILSV